MLIYMNNIIYENEEYYFILRKLKNYRREKMQRLTNNTPIVIQGAMKTETDWLISQLESHKEIEICGYKFHQGYIGETYVVISKTEIGQINAAAATALAIKQFSPSLIINQGTTGGHGDIHKGNILVATSAFNSTSFITSADNDEWILGSYTEGQPEGTGPEFLECDTELVKKAICLCKKISIDRDVCSGIIASGDLWNKNISRIKKMNEKYHEVAEEMELYAVLQVAKKSNVPVIGIRIISNNETLGEKFDNNELPKVCQQIVAEIAKSIV